MAVLMFDILLILEMTKTIMVMMKAISNLGLQVGKRWFWNDKWMFMQRLPG